MQNYYFRINRRQFWTGDASIFYIFNKKSSKAYGFLNIVCKKPISFWRLYGATKQTPWVFDTFYRPDEFNFQPAKAYRFLHRFAFFDFAWISIPFLYHSRTSSAPQIESLKKLLPVAFRKASPCDNHPSAGHTSANNQPYSSQQPLGKRFKYWRTHEKPFAKLFFVGSSTKNLAQNSFGWDWSSKIVSKYVFGGMVHQKPFPKCCLIGVVIKNRFQNIFGCPSPCLVKHRSYCGHQPQA